MMFLVLSLVFTIFQWIWGIRMDLGDENERQKNKFTIFQIVNALYIGISLVHVSAIFNLYEICIAIFVGFINPVIVLYTNTKGHKTDI